MFHSYIIMCVKTFITSKRTTRYKQLNRLRFKAPRQTSKLYENCLMLLSHVEY